MPDNVLRHIRQRHLAGEMGGVCAICSSHPWVLKAAMAAARSTGQMFLAEATPNQVNLSGGYSGMTPANFVTLMNRLAAECHLSPVALSVGADHLGPHLWRSEAAAVAMQRSRELVQACVRAGFNKIHLDTAVSCADDPGPSLAPDTVVQRAVDLCRAAEAVKDDTPSDEKPVYVIGNEVPVPGGGLEDGRDIKITDPFDLAAILALYDDRFKKAGLEDAWQRVIAVVVQPGIEFGDTAVAAYRAGRARALSEYHDQLPSNMTYEVHSADYQSSTHLHQLVQQHFVIFKIGPCLTRCLHQTLFALADIEDRWAAATIKSHLRQVMETVMLDAPEHWQTHYRGDPASQKELREKSLRDRIRYYWNAPEAVRAVAVMLNNLDRPLPEKLVHRFFADIIDGPEENGMPDARGLIQRRLQRALEPYYAACGADCER